MKITFSDGRLNKVHISVDGEYVFTVDSEYWYSCKWRNTSEIDEPEDEEEFYNEIGSRAAFISGLRVLSYGDNSRKELRRKLISKGHKAQYVDFALEKLEEYGYINDERFASYFAERLVRTKHSSKNGIKNELMLKGISREIADNVLSKMEFSPVEDIKAVIEKKYKNHINNEKGLKKTVAGLQRLGYNWSDIKSALNEFDTGEEEYFDD